MHVLLVVSLKNIKNKIENQPSIRLVKKRKKKTSSSQVGHPLRADAHRRLSLIHFSPMPSGDHPTSLFLPSAAAASTPAMGARDLRNVSPNPPPRPPASFARGRSVARALSQIRHSRPHAGFPAPAAALFLVVILPAPGSSWPAVRGSRPSCPRPRMGSRRFRFPA